MAVARSSQENVRERLRAEEEQLSAARAEDPVNELKVFKLELVVANSKLDLATLNMDASPDDPLRSRMVETALLNVDSANKAYQMMLGTVKVQQGKFCPQMQVFTPNAVILVCMRLRW